MTERRSLELWGGVECTLVRIGQRYRNQLEETGHLHRASDLDMVKALGIPTLRYPVLWEAIAPGHPDRCDWRWHDVRYARLRDLGIRPIVGLLHHGSGPHYTNLLDPAFPGLLARHAERVAERYPWVNLFTPVNEPLTTGRFSGLYGHWYPHAADTGSFLRAVVLQCKATLLAMRAIRRRTPHAQLVQTEDVGKTFSTPALAHQANYENERRWLSLDLLCGRVDKTHPWHALLLDHGISRADLDLLREGDAAPDLIGVNHYLTSERYLDEAAHAYPACLHGSNGQQSYADVEAVRIDLPRNELGPKARLAEVWHRYGRPMAVTEVHHGCSRDEQLRWLAEVWTAAQDLNAEGQDIRAVTLWSLFGAVDWNSLLVAQQGFYEPGAFDIRAPEPRRTALGHAAQSLARTGSFTHPVLEGHGWWRRETRFYKRGSSRPDKRRPSPLHPLLIIGASGTLGHAFTRICAERGLNAVATARKELEITDALSIRAAIARYKPWAVVNAAGFVCVAEAEREAQACFRANSLGAETVARACALHDLPFVTFSSDLVFDGRHGRAYVESDSTNPIGAYGQSKADAERRVTAAHPRALVIRTSAFFGPWDRYNFGYTLLCALSGHGAMPSLSHDIVSPTYVPDLVHAALDLLIDGESGIWHLANRGEVSWSGFAAKLAAEVGLVAPVSPASQVGRVRNTALASERGWIMPTLESAVSRFVRDGELLWKPTATLAAAE
jgi:dTDP-4-dehydrorhamnose reductase